MALNLSWDERDLPDGRWFRSQFGPLHFLVHNRGDEWQVASTFGEDFDELPEEGESALLPDDLPWRRWSCEENDRKVLLRPAFPEFALVAKPRNEFTIAPSSSTLFFIGVPASIAVHASSRGALEPLATLPTQKLSKSWHGNRSVGNLCHALRTRARRFYDPEDWPEHDIVCAIDLKNHRSTNFAFESLYLDTGHLAIFEQDGRLWSNACRVNIPEDLEEGADLTYAPRPLDPAADARELVEPRLGRTRRSTLLSAFSSFTDVLR